MVATRKSRLPRKFKRSGKKVKSVSVGGVVSLRDRIKRVVNGTTETKYVTETILDGRSGTYVNFNSTILTGPDWYRVIPQLPQGSGSTSDVSWVREGADVTPINQKINWEFRFGKTDMNTRDIYVVLYVIQPVAQKSYGSASVNSSMNFPAQFLKTGSASVTYANQQGFTGAPLDSYLPIYNKSFRLLHKKIFRLAKPSGDPNGAGVVDGTGSGVGMYSVGQLCKRHTWVNKHLPKTLKYAENAAVTWPANASPYWAVGYYYANGTPADTTGGLLNVSCITEMTFKDD